MQFEAGQRFQHTFQVTDAVYDGFKLLFKDLNPLHTDEKFAKEKGFSGRVMHGNILNGFLSFFVGELLPTKDVIIHSQQIQFKNPVYLGDELAFEAVVDGVYESVQAIEFKFTFRNAASKVVSKGNLQIGLI